jgi:hypothetical protein
MTALGAGTESGQTVIISTGKKAPVVQLEMQQDVAQLPRVRPGLIPLTWEARHILIPTDVWAETVLVPSDSVVERMGHVEVDAKESRNILLRRAR